MRSDVLPAWVSTEVAVRRFFELNGFDVESVSVAGRQIDLVARRPDTFGFDPETWIIEVTTERVDAAKGARDYQKLELGRKAYPGARMMLVSTAGFTDDQRASLRALGVVALTYSELESRQINLTRFAHLALSGLGANSTDIGYDPSSFIEPELRLRREGTEVVQVAASAWMKDLLDNPAAIVCAVLGDLGSGKTSLLQRIVEVGSRLFLDDPNQRSLPIFVPLGRYKQHSGDLEQMLMSEFRRAGQESYPAALVRHLLDHRRLILLLDGLDEIHPLQSSEDVLETVQGLLDSVGRSATAILSCRRQFLSTTADELAYFGSYTSSHLQDIQAGIARTLRGLPSTYIAEVVPFDRARIDSYLANRCGMSTAEGDAFFSRFYGFADMAQTPVLLAMMATTVRDGLIDPTEADPFPLLTLYGAYTNRWIERDVGRARLSRDQRRLLSIALAEHMLWQGRESAAWPYLRQVLREERAWKDNPLSDEQAELDIRSSGFLVRDLDNQYRFIHRSILEYFAADAERRRLEGGERPRHFPTDGFRTFLTTFLASRWMETGNSPFPHRSWGLERGENVIEAQMSMLSAASALMPPEGPRVSLRGIPLARTQGRSSWRSVQFKEVKWRHTSGDLVFRNCGFDEVELMIENGSRPSFDHCEFVATRIALQNPPTWTPLESTMDGPRARLGLSAPYWELSGLVDRGAEVIVAGRRWNIGVSTLDLCAQAWARVAAGKIRKDNFARGTRAAELAGIVDVLVRKGLLLEDASRTGHQLEASPGLRALVGRVANDPLSTQPDLQVFAGAPRG